MKKLILTVTAAVALAASASAFAHGFKAKHGGIVQTASDLQFELVTKDDTATIYVEDHGKKLATAGASGKLTVLNGAEKSEVPLQPVGENTLEAKGVTKLIPGAKAVATITFVDKKTVNARFTVK
jgi:hypothetical protein